MNTGLFDGLTYKFDGQDLIFQITPAAQLFPPRLENLPLGSAAEIDAKLHLRLPLYHGKVPTEGGILSDICAALKEELKAHGIEANVEAAPYTDQISHKITAVSFSITSPAVVVGDIHPEGALDPTALAAITEASGMSYDRDGSARTIEKYAGDAYREMGYLEADARATQQENPAIAPEAIRIPFQLSVSTGLLYKIAAIQLAPGMAVTQAEFDKQSLIHPGDAADGVHVRQNWSSSPANTTITDISGPRSTPRKPSIARKAPCVIPWMPNRVRSTPWAP
jgi:hypothetical protein